ncbi:MAG: hypothetical protein MJA30_37010 [Cytophagales bacterium]|nr:hypothetical protein [Cytophagales bacterium]
MKKSRPQIVNILFFAFALFVSYGCEEEYEAPGPEFSDPVPVKGSSTIEVGNVVSLGDVSRGVVSRTWTAPESAQIVNDNDAQTSSKDIVHIRFTQPGLFEVSLNSTFVDPGVVLDTAFEVTVLDSIAASMEYTTDPVEHANGIYHPASGTIIIEAGSPVYFKEVSVGAPDTRQWFFEGGDPEEAGENEADTAVAVLYKRLGLYDVQIISSRESPFGRPDTLLLNDFVEVIPSTQPVDVISIQENQESRLQIFFSRGIDAATVLSKETNFTLMVDGVEAVITRVFVDPSDESIVNIVPAEDIKNFQVATLTYADGGIFSTDSYELDDFGPLDVELHAPNLLASIDPGFESGTSTFGNAFGPLPTGATVEATTEDSFSGGYSLKVNIPNDGLQNNLFTQSAVIALPLEDGKAYGIEFKYKQSTLHTGQWTIRLQPGDGWADSYKLFNCGDCADFISDGEWHTRRVFKDIKSDTWDDFKIHIQFIGEVDVPIVYYLDDFKIFEIDE